MNLYHYTCDHGRAALGDNGILLPLRDWNPTVASGLEPPYDWFATVSWATDMPQPDRAALGLTSHTVGCDRTQHRYKILDTDGWVWWPKCRRLVPALVRQGLEGARGAMPMHWWVSTSPAIVALDEKGLH